MAARHQWTANPSLAKRAEDHIEVLQNGLKSGRGQAEQRVRELERAQLFYAVVCRLGSDEPVMPEVARAQVRF